METGRQRALAATGDNLEVGCAPRRLQPSLNFYGVIGSRGVDAFSMDVGAQSGLLRVRRQRREQGGCVELIQCFGGSGKFPRLGRTGRCGAIHIGHQCKKFPRCRFTMKKIFR